MALYGTYLICMPNTLYAYGPVNQALLLDFNFDSSFSQELYLKYQQLFYKTVIRFFLIGCHKFKLLHTFDKSNISFDRSETQKQVGKDLVVFNQVFGIEIECQYFPWLKQIVFSFYVWNNYDNQIASRQHSQAFILFSQPMAVMMNNKNRNPTCLEERFQWSLNTPINYKLFKARNFLA